MTNLKALRESYSLTQQQMADILKIQRPTYSRYETGERQPDFELLLKLANHFNVSTDYLLGNTAHDEKTRKGVLIPVLGRVAAGIPIDAVEEIIGYEEITPEMASAGEYFALKVKGHSMEPKFSEGDVVIVKKQSDADTGNIVVALINGNDATLKKIKKQEDGITLIPTNPTYDIMFFSNKEIEELPVLIIGKVVELRAKF